jgi:hypothetical protein
MSDLKKVFSQRIQEEFGSGDTTSFFLAATAISKYETAVAVPTAKREASFDIDAAGNLVSPGSNR